MPLFISCTGNMEGKIRFRKRSVRMDSVSISRSDFSLINRASRNISVRELINALPWPLEIALGWGLLCASYKSTGDENPTCIRNPWSKSFEFPKLRVHVVLVKSCRQSKHTAAHLSISQKMPKTTFSQPYITIHVYEKD